jgi:hypothetical protein
MRVCGVLVVGFALLVEGTGAQTVRGRGVAAADRVMTADCPVASPPVTADSVASSTDYIELRRMPCARGCTAYRVRVVGDGRVSWLGEQLVVQGGAAAATISSIDAKALIQRAPDRGFWGLCGVYAKGTGEQQTLVTTVSIAGHVKTVTDTGDAAPAWLRELDGEIDETTDTHRWRHGEPDQETFGLDRVIEDTMAPKDGVTRLMRVASGRDMGVLAEMLADTALDLNAVDSSGWTALMYAAQAGTAEAVAMLLQVRADASRRSYEGESAMFAAVSSPYDPVQKVRMLKAVGVDINGQDHRGMTPLMIAARHFQVKGLVATMIQLAADPAKRDANGRTALDYLEIEERAVPNAAYESVRGLLQAK